MEEWKRAVLALLTMVVSLVMAWGMVKLGWTK